MSYGLVLVRVRVRLTLRTPAHVRNALEGEQKLPPLFTPQPELELIQTHMTQKPMLRVEVPLRPIEQAITSSLFSWWTEEAHLVK